MSAKWRLAAFVACMISTYVTGQSGSCGQCPASECDAPSRHCPTFPLPFLCLSGTSVNGCSNTSWVMNSACTSCCDERTCFQNDCSVACNATVCASAQCNVQLNPFTCYAGANSGQCGPTVATFENPPYSDDCRACCNLALCGATTPSPPVTQAPTTPVPTTPVPTTHRPRSLTRHIVTHSASMSRSIHRHATLTSLQTATRERLSASRVYTETQDRVSPTRQANRTATHDLTLSVDRSSNTHMWTLTKERLTHTPLFTETRNRWGSLTRMASPTQQRNSTTLRSTLTSDLTITKYRFSESLKITPTDTPEHSTTAERVSPTRAPTATAGLEHSVTLEPPPPTPPPVAALCQEVACGLSRCDSTAARCGDTVYYLCVMGEQSAAEEVLCASTFGSVQAANCSLCCGPCPARAAPAVTAASHFSNAVVASASLLGSASVVALSTTQTTAVATLVCTWEAVRSFSQPASWVLSPIGTWAPQPATLSHLPREAWSILGNIILIAGVFLLHAVAAQISTNRQPWRVYFPALSIALIVFLSEGMFMYATELLAVKSVSVGASSRSLVSLVAVSGIFVGCIPFIIVGLVQWRWVFLDEQRLFEDRDVRRAPLRKRVIFFFTSASYWTPTATAKGWGSVFAMYRAETKWFHFVLLGGNALTAIVVGVSRDASACATQVTLITLIYAVQLLLMIVFTPFRQYFLQSLSVLTSGVRLTEMVTLVAYVWGNNPAGNSLSRVGFDLHMVANVAMVLLTVLCVVAAVLDRFHTAPQVRQRESDLQESVSFATSQEQDGYLFIDGDILTSGSRKSNPVAPGAASWVRFLLPSAARVRRLNGSELEERPSERALINEEQNPE